MTANLRIVPKNDWDDATLTPSATEESGFEVENTQNTIRYKAWRTTSNSGVSVTAVFDTARTLSHFSMHRHLCQAGSVKLELFSDVGASVSLYDSTALSATPYTATEPYVWSEGSNDPLKTSAPYWLWFAEKASVRSAKITFSGTPSQAYWQVSRIWLGRYLELDRSAARGIGLGQDDNTDRERSQGGSLRTNEGEIWRKMTFDLNAINEDELATWADIRAYAGTTRDVVVSVFPGNGTRKEALYTLAGRFSNMNDIGRPTKVMTMRVQMEEN